MKALFFSLSLLFLLPVSNAQTFKNGQHDGTRTYQDMSHDFQDWAKNKDLEQAKGWKWFKRWEEHYKTRLNAKGELVSPTSFLLEASKMAVAKGNSRWSDDSNWLPAGPNYVPFAASGGATHGISRVNCITFHPTDESTFWIGASQGGIWKTTDFGASWTPLNDGLPILRISDIAVDPNNTDVMYACLGDYEYNGVALNLDDRKRHTHYGLGVYKTTDGGLSWNQTGLTVLLEDLDYSLLRRVVIHPENSNQLVAIGFEGIWKSTDGGENWENTVANILGCDLVQDPDNPSTLYAASTYSGSLGEGSTRLMKSEDFGSTWTILDTSIPASGVVDRVALALAPSNPQVVYALTVDLFGGLHNIYKSTNAGVSWTQQTDEFTPNILHWGQGGSSGGQGSYDLAFAVDPNDENRIFAGGINMWGSEDGGTIWNPVSYWVDNFGPSLHADQHQFKFNPLNDRFYVTNDGGVVYSDNVIIDSWGIAGTNGWSTAWTNVSDGMQITSFYRVGISNNQPEYIICGSQDNGTFYFDGDLWTKIIGGDGMNCLLHPDDGLTLMGSSQYGNLASSNNGGVSVDYGVTNLILNQENGEWTTPFIYDALTDYLFAGFGNLWTSPDWGQSWNKISNFDNMNGETYPAPCSAFEQCETQPNAIYFASRLWSSNGTLSRMYVTFLGGEDWVEITDGLPNELYFTDVVVDAYDPNMAWVTCSGFEDGQKVYKTSDGGQTWENISLDLPNIPVNCIALDKNDINQRIYLGTDLGVFTLSNGENSWSPFTENLPLVIVSDLDINPQTNELYAATFGRGIWKTDIVSLTESISEGNLVQPEITVFPSPNLGNFSIELFLHEPTQAQIGIVNIMGQEVFNSQINLAAGKNVVPLSLDLNPGVYFVQIKWQGFSRAVKFVVKS